MAEVQQNGKLCEIDEIKKNPGNFNLTRKIEIISLVEKVVKIHIEKKSLV